MSSKRKCRKCDETIPNRVKIDDVWKNLQNRKFCLKCSPFKNHNTSPHDPLLRKKGKKYKEYSDKTKKTITLSLYKRALERKHKLIQEAGGGCQQCGYEKSWRALTFHHLDPSTKSFGLTLNMLWSQSMEKITKEAEKCQLLCMNCHAELGQVTKFNIVAEVNDKYGTNFQE